MLEKAIEKLNAELEKAKEKGFAEPILGYIKKRCEEDNGLCEDILQEHKSWEKCFKYIYDQAHILAKGARAYAVKDELVYEWAEDYYRKDDKAEEEEKAKKEAERKQKEAERKKKEAEEKEKTPVQNTNEKKETEKKTEEKKVDKENLEGQMDIFSFMGM